MTAAVWTFAWVVVSVPAALVIGAAIHGTRREAAMAAAGGDEAGVERAA